MSASKLIVSAVAVLGIAAIAGCTVRESRPSERIEYVAAGPSKEERMLKMCEPQAINVGGRTYLCVPEVTFKGDDILVTNHVFDPAYGKWLTPPEEAKK